MSLSRLGLMILTVTLAACAAPTPPGPAAPLTVPNAAQILQEEVSGLAAPPPPLRLAPPPPDPLRETRVSLAGSGIPLREVLHRLSRAADLLLVVEPEVAADRPVDVAVDDRPLAEALRTVLAPLGLFARREGTTLVVFAFETRTWSDVVVSPTSET